MPTNGKFSPTIELWQRRKNAPNLRASAIGARHQRLVRVARWTIGPDHSAVKDGSHGMGSSSRATGNGCTVMSRGSHWAAKMPNTAPSGWGGFGSPPTAKAARNHSHRNSGTPSGTGPKRLASTTPTSWRLSKCFLTQTLKSGDASPTVTNNTKRGMALPALTG